MPDKILHKRSYTSGSRPTTSNLDPGELAINVSDGKAYLRKSGSQGDTIETFVSTNTITSGSITISGSTTITGSVNISGSLNASIITGSLYGTASWASSSISSSWATNVNTASWASNINTASWANNVTTASRALQSNTASYIQNAASASYAFSASNAQTASYIFTASWANNAVSSSWATNINTASWASNAVSSSWATNINTASWANNATNAVSSSWATNINTASWANNVTTASRAIQANTASYIQLAASSSYALSGSYTLTSSNAFSASYSFSSSYAMSASNALSSSFSANAANAFIQEGNSFSTGALLGTNDNHPLFFETSGSIRVKINNSGIPFSIQYVDYATTVSTTLTLPSNLLPNDVIIVACHNTNVAPAIPTGYTIGQSGSANTVNYLWAYKVMGSPVDTTVSGLVVGSNMAFVFRNVDTSSIVHATGTPSTGTTLMPDPPSVTTTISGSMIVAIGYLDDDTISPTLISASLGFNLIGSITSGSGTNGGVTMAEYFQQTTPGAIDPGTFNSGSAAANDAWVGVTFALTPLTASGFVGINTVTPQTPLHAYASTNDGTILGRTTPLNVLTLESENTATSEYGGFGQALAFRGVTYNNTSSRVLGRIIHKINDDSVNTTRGTSIHFETLPNATSILPTEKMVINYLGYVGIGTSEPTTLLHVAGIVSASAFTGSLFGTSSWAFVASSSLSSSYALSASNAQTSSYVFTASWANNVINAVSSSWATNVNTASWASNINTASWANNVTTASRALQSNTASYVQLAASSSYAFSASYAMSTSFAINAANAFVQGGNSFGATAVLGTNDLQNLELETNGSTRMFVSSSGNIGIGTTSPVSRLAVYDTSNFFPGTFGGGSATPNVVAIGTVSGISSINGYTYNFSTTTNLSLQPQGGNLGVGTTTPSSSLHIANTNPRGVIIGTTTGSTGTVQIVGGSSVVVSPVAGRLMFGTDGTGYQFRIAKNQAGTITDLLYVQDNGNVSASTFVSTQASIYYNNTSTYGHWVISGSKGSYGGIYDAYSAVNGVMYDSAGNGGIFKEGLAWYIYYNTTNTCLAVNGSTTSTTYALYVNGKGIYSVGDVVAYSDKRKKTDIVTVDNALDKVKNLRGVYYTKVGEEEKGRKLGVIAQEVEQVLPEVVSYAKDVDEYGVAYGNIVGVLIEAIKEQQKQIEDLQKQINYLAENKQ